MKKILSGLAVVAFALAGNVYADAGSGHGDMSKPFGTMCAYGLSMGKSVNTDCTINWTDTNTKMEYCFSNEEAKTNWAKDIHGNMAKATTEYGKMHSNPTHQG